MRRDHDVVARAAVAERRLGLGVAFDICVPNLEGVVAESPELVAAHRARAGRGRGGVEEEVHAPVVVKVGEEQLLRVGELDARVAARVAGEARVRFLREPTAGNGQIHKAWIVEAYSPD